MSAVVSLPGRKTSAISHAAALLLCALAGVPCGCSSNPASPQNKRVRVPTALFHADTSLSVEDAPWSLAVADFSGDSVPDVAVACLGGKSVVMYTNGEGGAIFHRQKKVPADTTFRFSGGFRPRSVATADVNADGLPDLVVALAQDSVVSGLDRIVVLLNQRVSTGSSAYSVGADYVAGSGVRDLFIGDLDPGDGGVEIVGASSVPGVAPVVLARATRVARAGEAIDSTINLLGFSPADGASNLGLRTPVSFWFDTEVKNMSALANLDSQWVQITGTIDNSGQTRRIPVSVAKQTRRVNYASYTEYVLTPLTPYRPHETVTVSLTGRILSLQSNDRRTIALTNPRSWSFSTEGTRIVSSIPANGATHVPTTSPVSLRFNFWLDPASVDGALTILGASGTIPFACTHAADTLSSVVTLTPQRAFEPYETVRVIGLPTLRDSTGRPTFAGDTVSFRATGPQVVATSPVNGATTRLAGNTLTVSFNTRMAMDNPQAVLVVGEQSGAHPIASLSSPDGGYTAHVALAGNFIGGEVVTATVTSAFVSAVSSFPLARPHVWRFSIQPSAPASLTKRDPVAGDLFAGGSVAAGRFTALDDGRGVLLSDPTGSLALFSGGSGTWTQAASLTGIPGRSCTRAGDLNGDGLLDIVVAAADSDFVQVYFNASGAASTPAFEKPVRLPVGGQPVGVFIADLNGDGRPDIATANRATNDVSILLNNGNKTFAGEVFVAAGNNPQAISGADLDGDGDIDLVVANATDNTITLIRNLTGFREPPQTGAKRGNGGVR